MFCGGQGHGACKAVSLLQVVQSYREVADETESPFVILEMEADDVKVHCCFNAQ